MKRPVRGLVGTKLPGSISKVVSETYEYTVQETGQVFLLNHRWVYSPSEAPMDEMVYQQLHPEPHSNECGLFFTTPQAQEYQSFPLLNAAQA